MNPGTAKLSFKVQLPPRAPVSEHAASLLELAPEFEEGREEKLATASILLADDCSVTRRGVRVILEDQPGWKVVAEASGGREAVSKAAEVKPDIAILSVRMRELNGLDAARLILKSTPQTRVLVMASYQTDEMVERALQAGVRGYILKSDAETVLMDAVKTLLEGRTFFSSAASEILVERMQRPRPRHGEPLLTVREAEIVQLLAEGHSNKEVAGILNLSSRTVENHRAQIMQRLGMRSFSELIRYAIRIGIVEP